MASKLLNTAKIYDRILALYLSLPELIENKRKSDTNFSVDLSICAILLNQPPNGIPIQGIKAFLGIPLDKETPEGMKVTERVVVLKDRWVLAAEIQYGLRRFMLSEKMIRMINDTKLCDIDDRDIVTLNLQEDFLQRVRQVRIANGQQDLINRNKNNRLFGSRKPIRGKELSSL